MTKKFQKYTCILCKSQAEKLLDVFMSTQGEKPTPSSATSSTAAAPKGGIHAALKYTGIPASWLTKRPKLPSRNWLIFIGVTTSLIGLYAYDRKKCREIRELYVKKVEHLAQEPMGSMELPRKVTVYASKWPGDEDADRSLRYFRKYVKVRETLLLDSV